MVLYRHIAGDVDQHGAVLEPLAAQLANRAGQDEGMDRLAQRLGNRLLAVVDRNVGLLVLGRHPPRLCLGVVVVEDAARERQRADAALLGQLAEHAGGADVVRRRRQVDDEGLGKEVGAFGDGRALVVDVDVGKGRGRIAYIGLAAERVQDATDEAVDGLGRMLLIRRAVLVEELLAGVHRRVVRLVVDHQQRQLGHEPPVLAVRDRVL